MSKAELVELVKHLVNVDLENDRDNFLNKKRKVLYTQITRKDRYSVMPLLARMGIRVESHLNDYYFIYLG